VHRIHLLDTEFTNGNAANWAITENMVKPIKDLSLMTPETILIFF